MKFRKPEPQANPRADDRAILDFFDSLPSEFEILGPGEAAVKWPGGWTREYLLRSSRGDYGNDISLRAWLEALADIAPERKKSQVYIWKDSRGKYQVSAACFFPGNEFGWARVAGPIEIDD